MPPARGTDYLGKWNLGALAQRRCVLNAVLRTTALCTPERLHRAFPLPPPPPEAYRTTHFLSIPSERHRRGKHKFRLSHREPMNLYATQHLTAVISNGRMDFRVHVSKPRCGEEGGGGQLVVEANA